jgi:hypothetical protein
MNRRFRLFIVTIDKDMRAILPVLLLLLSSTARLFAWSCEGHQIVALIARAHLTAAAAAAVDLLLTQNPIDPALKRFCGAAVDVTRPADLMADASTWADDVKYNPEKTAAWHFVDIPLTGPLTTNSGTSLDPWCPPIGPSVNGKERPGCVTNALEYELSILRDKSRPHAERAKALRYVIHLVGDIHQPLHDSNNNDEGGNCTALHFFAEVPPAKLHAIWDYKLIQRDLASRHLTQTPYAKSLDRGFTSRTLNPVDWAWEGHQLAIEVVYGDLKPSIPLEAPTAHHDCPAETGKVAALDISIGQPYFDQALPVIYEQLNKAGYRLAALLNQIAW